MQECFRNKARAGGIDVAVPIRLLAVGEETGHLDTMFNRMADIYDGETRTAIRRFTALFEPIIILVMGLVVGSLIMSLMLAITSINDIAI